jgi:hypothetical protein
MPKGTPDTSAGRIDFRSRMHDLRSQLRRLVTRTSIEASGNMMPLKSEGYAGYSSITQPGPIDVKAPTTYTSQPTIADQSRSINGQSHIEVLKADTTSAATNDYKVSTFDQMPMFRAPGLGQIEIDKIRRNQKPIINLPTIIPDIPLISENKIGTNSLPGDSGSIPSEPNWEKGDPLPDASEALLARIREQLRLIDPNYSFGFGDEQISSIKLSKYKLDVNF